MFKEIQNTMVHLDKKQASALSSSSPSMKTSVLKSFKHFMCFDKQVNYYCLCPNCEHFISCWTSLIRLDKFPSCRAPFKITSPSCDGLVSTKLKNLNSSLASLPAWARTRLQKRRHDNIIANYL